MKIPEAVFKAYDIRGVVGLELTPPLLTQLGLAIGSTSIDKGERHIIVARDGRLSGPALIDALKIGLKQSGCHVMDIGMVPTPVLYYATHTKGATSGIMLTGSHNPAQYNGLKITIAGKPLFGEQIQQLKQRLIKQAFSSGDGTLSAADIKDDYINTITSRLTLNRKLKIVIDCGNGIAGSIAPMLYRQLGCEVIDLFCDVDGTFPNHHPDPSQAENMRDLTATVLTEKADLGLAFDGDGDRLGVVDNKGNIICSDRQIMLYATELIKRQPNCKIIYDIKCTNLLPEKINELGGIAILSRTGHSFIKQKMADENALLGGEMSGHLFFKDNWYGFDDALYAGAKLLQIIAEQTLTSSALFATMPENYSTPEIQIPCAYEGAQFVAIETLKRHQTFDKSAKIIDIDGVRVEFNNAWGLVRASNTTPCLVLRFEGKSKQALNDIQSQFQHWFNASGVPFFTNKTLI